MQFSSLFRRNAGYPGGPGIALAFLLAAAPAWTQTIVDRHGQLKVQGNRIVDKGGQTVTLRGMALYWSQWQPAFYNANCIRWLRDDWKVTVVRASMAVGYGGYLEKPAEEMNKIKTVIQAAVDLGIYIIVDFHETDNGNDHIEQSKTFFGEISKTYGHLPNIIYETWNEPLNTHAWATVIKPYHETIIKVIRANDPDNIILCGTKSWSQDVDEASRSPITISDNIAYTLHFYAGTHKESLRTKARTALANGIPLMVTEGGLSDATGDGTLDTAEARRWLNFLDENGIAWTNWSLSAITESSSALRPGASPTGNWGANNISESGTWVRNHLRAMDGKTVTTGIRIAPKAARALKASGGALVTALEMDFAVQGGRKIDPAGKTTERGLLRNSGPYIRLPE